MGKPIETCDKDASNIFTLTPATNKRSDTLLHKYDNLCRTISQENYLLSTWSRLLPGVVLNLNFQLLQFSIKVTTTSDAILCYCALHENQDG